MDMIIMTPVGVVHNGVQDKVDENWGSIRSKIMLEPGYRGGLQGLQEFSHVIILTYLNEAHYEPERHLQRHPRGLTELPLVGIFAQRAKDRPNRIGVTAVSLLAVGEDWLEVEGLDAIDGTAVLDIKPYFPAYDLQKNAFTPDWVDFILKGYF
jgi:tRNA (adenine37-N6)-methyltransferase